MWHRTADAWMQEASRFQFVTGGVTDIENGDGRTEGQIQITADVGKRFRQGLGPSGPHVL
jgi:hypothetical protein